MATLGKYTVPPFSQKTREHNVLDDEFECGICGRSVKTPIQHEGIVINAGTDWGDDSSDQNDPGYMGCWAIGSDCHRKYKVKQRS